MYNTVSYKTARFLGWFSIGLGVAELIAPGALNRSLGMREHNSLVRAFGLRAGRFERCFRYPSLRFHRRFTRDECSEGGVGVSRRFLRSSELRGQFLARSSRLGQALRDRLPFGLECICRAFGIRLQSLEEWPGKRIHWKVCSQVGKSIGSMAA